ncbi:DUF421 domain-containing protein [Indioceanicola profundi]|uniref:DUF421 domain-containing protein n=1 Tax=Indioceanicola profundi TaxID=2220096 RepID=UPI000E6AD2CE|nr:YetF domain-containing protein [Indioceanicola profundi]
MFFDSWPDLGRTLVVGALAYVGLVFLLRISGPRTLSKMNAFDLIVTVALGSTLATVLLSKDVALAEGMLAFALLIGLQFVITWLSVRSEGFQRLIKDEPALVAWQGRLLPEPMKARRVTREEVMAAIRAQGHSGMDSVGAVVLETDGSFSIVGSPVNSPAEAMDPVGGAARRMVTSGPAARTGDAPPG